MKLADRIRVFFLTVEEIWSVVPGYIKVFFYSVVSSSIGLWVLGELNWQAIAIILFTNLGLYSGPKAINKIMK